MSESKQRIIGVLGSSRADGNTVKLADMVFGGLDDAKLIDLTPLAIGPYSYDKIHEGDDFHALALAMANADTIVFASPVYWYSMSAQMKAVFDRMTDMTDIYKQLGKSLAGKSMFVISTGSGPDAPDSFVRPFADTAGYFKMKWGGVLYAPGGDLNSEKAHNAARIFASQIAASIRVPMASAPA